MSALPKNLVPMPKQRQVAGIKSQTIELSPTNGSFQTNYSPLERVIFQIPSYPNGFLDTSKSFLKFKPTITGADCAFEDGLPVIERLIVRSGSGAVLEDIQDVDLLENILEGLMEKSSGSARKALRGDGLDTFAEKRTRQDGNFVIKRLAGGVLGPDQQFYLPLHLMGGPYALEVEIMLNSALRCMRSDTNNAPDYTLRGMTLQLEIVNMPEDVCKKLDVAICGGEELSVPFSSYKSYRHSIPTGVDQISLQVHEVSPNVEEVILALRNNNYNVGNGTNRFLLNGGSESGGFVVDEYQFRYADRYMPLQPVKDLTNGSAPALMNVLRDIPVENPTICEDASPGVPKYFNGKFFVLQNMETDKDLVSGLSTQAHAGPIESFLKFTGARTIVQTATHFVKSSHTISVSRNGVAGLGMVA